MRLDREQIVQALEDLAGSSMLGPYVATVAQTAKEEIGRLMEELQDKDNHITYLEDLVESYEQGDASQ